MKSKNFVNIDKDQSMVYMYEMYLTIFIKKEHALEVSKVMQTKLEKGFSYGLGQVGNKGGIAYSFKLKNRNCIFI